MENVFYIIILGSLWGIFEASVGYFLHMLALPLGSFIWYPMAFFFINKAYKATKSYGYVLMIAFIAASFKLLNLFFPGSLDMVLNPSVSMIMEAAAYILAVRHINANHKSLDFFYVLLTGFTWRSFYLCYVILMPDSIVPPSLITDTSKLVKHMFLYNITNSMLICFCRFAFGKMQAPRLYEKIINLFRKKAVLYK